MFVHESDGTEMYADKRRSAPTGFVMAIFESIGATQLPSGIKRKSNTNCEAECVYHITDHFHTDKDCASSAADRFNMAHTF